MRPSRIERLRRLWFLCVWNTFLVFTGKTLKDAFQVILKSGRRPIRLQTDKGTEFINRVFQTFLKEHDMHFFTTYNEDNKYLNPLL
jgi:hypothetical protein